MRQFIDERRGPGMGLRSRNWQWRSSAAASTACCAVLGMLAVLAGCSGSSTAKRAGVASSTPAGSTVAQQPGAGWVSPSGGTSAPADRLASQFATCQQAALARQKASAKNLPRATGHDIQCLADTLTVADVSHPGTVTDYRAIPDPTAGSRTLASTILSSVQADLDAFDKAAYAQGPGAAPAFVVAIATPKAGLANFDFVGQILGGFPLTGVFTPPVLGANGQAHRLSIACGSSPTQEQTLCVWEGAGRTTAGEQGFDGALLFPSVVASGLAESKAEAVIASLAPVA